MSVNLLIPVFLNCLSSFFNFCSEIALGLFFCTMIWIIILKNTFYSYTSACVMAICVVTQVRFHPRKAVWEFHSTSISFYFQFVPSFLLFPRWLSTCGIYMHCWKVCYTQVNFRRYSFASQAIQFNKTWHMHFTGTFTNSSNSNRGVTNISLWNREKRSKERTVSIEK